MKNYGTHAIFEKPTIDYRGREYKAYRDGNIGKATFRDENLPVGTFEIDPYESNEDQLVIYF